MNSAEKELQRQFYRAVTPQSLSPGHKFYVPIYEQEGADEDPIALLQNQIEMCTDNTSAHLLSGYRGSGKSTELQRLAQSLNSDGFLTVSTNIEKYVNTAVPIDISDMLLVLAGALGDGLQEQFGDGIAPSYWARFVDFLGRVRFQMDEVSVGFEAGYKDTSAAIRAGLQVDPSFQTRLQKHLSSHIGALVDDIRNYIENLTKGVLANSPSAQGIVFLVDSMEHFRDSSVTNNSVQSSVQTVFTEHADRLRFPGIHAVYTISPFVRVHAKASLTDRYDGETVMLRAVRVRERSSKTPYGPGLKTLKEIIRRRGPIDQVIKHDDQLQDLLLLSGGHLGDLLRLIQAAITRASTFPINKETTDLAIKSIRKELLPVAKEDATWLHKIASTGYSSLQRMEDLNRLASFLDSHLLLAYQTDGEEWYHPHPLIADEVSRLACENDS